MFDNNGVSSPFTTQGVDAHDGQIRLRVGIRAEVQIYHLLDYNILGFNRLQIKGREFRRVLVQDKIQTSIQNLTMIMSVNRRETSMPRVMYAITFLITSRLRLTSFSTLMFFRSCYQMAEVRKGFAQSACSVGLTCLSSLTSPFFWSTK